MNTEIQTQEMKLDAPTVATLSEAAKWAGGMSIIMYIFTGLFVLVLLGMLFMPSIPGKGAIIVLYAFICGIYFIFAKKLGSFKTNTVNAILAKDSSGLIKGLEPLKSYFKLSVILTIVLFVLALIVASSSGIAAASMMSSMM